MSFEIYLSLLASQKNLVFISLQKYLKNIFVGVNCVLLTDALRKSDGIKKILSIFSCECLEFFLLPVSVNV